MTVEQTIAKLRQLKHDLPVLVGNEMKNFALDNMRAEAWEGKPWPRRKKGAKRDAGRRLLIDTGDGERSVRVVRISSDTIELTANEYMIAHNAGVNKTVSVKAHRRKGHRVKGHSRKMNLPQRQFAGRSATLSGRIEKVWEMRVKKVFT